MGIWDGQVQVIALNPERPLKTEHLLNSEQLVPHKRKKICANLYHKYGKTSIGRTRNEIMLILAAQAYLPTSSASRIVNATFL
jgi:hypothetical protein